MDKRFDALEAYTPGEQPQDKQYVKLNTNESPYPPAERMLQAVQQQADSLNLYCDPQCRNLRLKAAELYDVGYDNVLAFNGSDEVLNFAFMAFCAKAAFPTISYGFYPVYAKLHGLDAVEIPLNDDLSIDYRKFCSLDRAVIIANPNAPTALALPRDEVEKIVQTNHDNVVIIDEAYVDFGAESAIPLTKKYDNLLVTRTFSKSHSLAGARLGFGIASKGLIDDLNKIRYSTNPYNVNRMTQAAGIAAIEDNAYYMDCCRKVIETREYTAAQLRKRGFELTDSKANFLFVRGSLSGEAMYRGLRERGVLVRWFGNTAISDYIRVSIGTTEQMNIFLEKIDELS